MSDYLRKARLSDHPILPKPSTLEILSHKVRQELNT